MRDRLLKLIKKYETEMDKTVIMDDYDGGKAATMLIVIEELKKVAKESKKFPQQQEVGVDY
jgi:hypothetical protein